MTILSERIKKQLDRFNYNHTQELFSIVLGDLVRGKRNKDIKDSDIQKSIDSVLFGNPKYLSEDS